MQLRRSESERKPFDAERITERRVREEHGLDQRVAVDDLIRFLALDRLVRLVGRDLVCHQRIALAERQDELGERLAVDDIAVVQRALELIAEQRAELLTVAHALEKRQRRAHALRSQLHGELRGVLLIGVRQVGVSQHRRGDRMVDRRPVDEAAVLGLLDDRDAVLAQRFGNLLGGDDGAGSGAGRTFSSQPYAPRCTPRFAGVALGFRRAAR